VNLQVSKLMKLNKYKIVEETEVQERQNFAYEEQQGVADSEDGQSQRTVTEEESSALVYENNIEEGHEGVQFETLRVYERNSTLRDVTRNEDSEGGRNHPSIK